MKICEYGDRSAPVVLIQPVDGHDLSVIEREEAEIRRLSDKDFCLIAVKIENWNRDLSPWRAPAVFGKEDFGDGAKETLEEILALCTDRDKTYILGGYSLAALFSLWAACRTGLFAAVCAASPSVWFPGFTDYMRTHEVMSSRVYLSLGDTEEKTRSPVMAAVGERIREIYDLLTAKGVLTVLEWNQGNHFKDADLRTAKAFAWALNGLG